MHREEGNVKTETKIGVVRPQAKEAKECQQPPEAGRGKDGFSLKASAKKSFILDFWPQNCDRIKFCCFKSPNLR